MRFYDDLIILICKNRKNNCNAQRKRQKNIKKPRNIEDGPSSPPLPYFFFKLNPSVISSSFSTCFTNT